jgi:hypothetical protein
LARFRAWSTSPRRGRFAVDERVARERARLTNRC